MALTEDVTVKTENTRGYELLTRHISTGAYLGTQGLWDVSLSEMNEIVNERRKHNKNDQIDYEIYYVEITKEVRTTVKTNRTQVF